MLLFANSLSRTKYPFCIRQLSTQLHDNSVVHDMHLSRPALLDMVSGLRCRIVVYDCVGS